MRPGRARDARARIVGRGERVLGAGGAVHAGSLSCFVLVRAGFTRLAPREAGVRRERPRDARRTRPGPFRVVRAALRARVADVPPDDTLERPRDTKL